MAMNGCEMIFIMNRLLDQNPNHKFRLHYHNSVIEDDAIYLHKAFFIAEPTFVKEDNPYHIQIAKIADPIDYEPVIVKQKKPWYIEASEKGGSKKRKPFIK